MDSKAFHISDRTNDLLLEKWKTSPDSFLFHIDDENHVLKHFHDSVDKERIRIGLDLLEHYVDVSGKRILEVGAGYGGMAILAKEYGFQYLGIESSIEIHTVGRSFLQDNSTETENYTLGDGEETGFGNEAFDIVFSINVLEHVENIDKILLEALRLVKQGGLVIFSFPNYNSFFEGHGGVFWIPYISNLHPYYYYRLCGMDRYRAHRLCEIQNFVTRRTIERLLRRFSDSGHRFTLIDFGETIFGERIHDYRSLSCWNCHHLGKLKKALDLADRLKVLTMLRALAVATKTYTPLVLALRRDF